MPKILVHLATGFEEMEAIIPIDIWRRAEYLATTVSITGNKAVTGAHNITVLADVLFEEANYDEADMIFLPGGMPGATNLDAHEGLRKQILNFDTKGKYLSAICAAPMVLGHNGLLKGKNATCFPGFQKELIGANTTDASVEVDGKIITGRSAGTASDLALAVVAEFSGQEKADELKAKMCFTN